jgi:ethanolamine ammonia-lyase large subunit
MELEDELENLKLKYSDADVDRILTDVLKDTNYEFITDTLISAFKNYYISKMERENGRI